MSEDLKLIIDNNEKTLQEMMKAGLHYGHKRTYNHPKASYFTVKSFGELNGIDLNETIKGLNKALEFIKETVAKGGVIMFVGTTASAKDLVKNLAQKFNYPYVTERWLGGTLTNFKTLIRRIKILKDLEEQKASGKWEQYVKKERNELDKNLLMLQKKFDGVRNLEKLPDALFVVDTGRHKIAVKEARLCEIPLIGILDTDDDPTQIDFPIPANDSARSALQYLLEKVEKAIEEGRKEASLIKETSQNKDKEN